VAQDITARHQATEDLRMLALRLESAQEAVRAAIAREVHDDLGQMLTVLRMDASRLGRLTSGTPEIAGLVKQMTETIDATLETARSVARDLHPTALEDLGLAAAIEMHVERVARRANLESTLELSESDGRIDRSVARAAFRILQESLTNVVRHAESSAVTVRLAVSNSELELEVTDNGRGIAEDALSRQGSFGLLSMRERAAAFEGSVTVMAAHPRGTRVLLRMPITRPGPQGGVE
jgi:two-component system sensor histidine kinase UhpB